MLVFTLGVSLLTGLLFGLAPALQATRLNLPALKNEASVYGPRRRRIALRDVLVIAQLAMSLVLLVSAGLFVRSLRQALTFDPGFATEIFSRLRWRHGARLNEQQGQEFYRQALERAGSLPGVQSATLSMVVPPPAAETVA